MTCGMLTTQYGIHPSDRDLLRLAVWNPELGRVQLLGANALPFGAIGSVSAFLRVAMAVWYIGVRGLRLCWTSFFDDYTMLSKRLTSRSAALAAESLFEMLGIDFARDGQKGCGMEHKSKDSGGRHRPQAAQWGGDSCTGSMSFLVSWNSFCRAGTCHKKTLNV